MNFLKKFLRPYATDSLIRAYHKGQAMLANLLYGFPARRLRVIGITGTNGKTTTAHLVGAILEAGGYKTAIASTVAFQIGGDREVNALNMTTPNPFILQRFLAKAVQAGTHVAVIETTSHALDQERVWGIRYDVAVMTNLTHDHLDYHKTFDSYRQAKMKLFSHRPQVIVANADDTSSKLLLEQEAYQHYTYGIDQKADINARKILLEPTGSVFTVVTPVGQAAVNLALPGRFNVMNALAAIAVGISQGIGLETAKAALEKITVVPGRMERVDIGQAFTVLIDYAHTPDAFEQIYSTLRPVTRGRIIHVFGATGDRDKTKRPIMGALAARNADLLVLTNEEPYSENPDTILEEIAKGLERGRTRKPTPGTKANGEEKVVRDSGEGSWWWQIPDRKDAIRQALTLARKGDVVLVTGMGDERFMTISDGAGGTEKIPWNERRIVKDLLLQLTRKE